MNILRFHRLFSFSALIIATMLFAIGGKRSIGEWPWQAIVSSCCGILSFAIMLWSLDKFAANCHKPVARSILHSSAWLFTASTIGFFVAIYCFEQTF
jgi:hypothetical protein